MNNANDMRPAVSTAPADLAQDWELVPKGQGGSVRRKATASNRQHTVEELYDFCRQRLASEDLITQNDAMGRDRPTGVPGMKRRYWVEDTWNLSDNDANFLVDGPLISGAKVIVPESGTRAQRVYIEEIDNFERVKDFSASEGSNLLSEGILPSPESEVKALILRILGDGFAHKDWGGERSDIYTSQVRINGRRLDSAFLLKGPGVRKGTIYIGDLGKRGDQVQRLFTEPASLFVIQCNGKFDSSVARHIRLEAESTKREIYYCIMDGNDTAKLFLAYDGQSESYAPG